MELRRAVDSVLGAEDAAAGIGFYVKAFDAVEQGRGPGPDGRLIHAALNINGSMVLLNDDFPEHSGGKSMTPSALGGAPCSLHLAAPAVDAADPTAVRAVCTRIDQCEGAVRDTRPGVV